MYATASHSTVPAGVVPAATLSDYDIRRLGYDPVEVRQLEAELQAMGMGLGFSIGGLVKGIGKGIGKAAKGVVKVGGKVVQTAAKIAPVAVAFIPGVGPVAAAGIVAGTKLVSGVTKKKSIGDIAQDTVTGAAEGAAAGAFNKYALKGQGYRGVPGALSTAAKKIRSPFQRGGIKAPQVPGFNDIQVPDAALPATLPGTPGGVAPVVPGDGQTAVMSRDAMRRGRRDSRWSPSQNAAPSNFDISAAFQDIKDRVSSVVPQAQGSNITISTPGSDAASPVAEASAAGGSSSALPLMLAAGALLFLSKR